MFDKKPLNELTAEDLMSRDVVTIHQTLSLREAAHVLRQAAVSGAAVVDDQGRAVGVISTKDFLHWVEGESPLKAQDTPHVCPYLIWGHPAGDCDEWYCLLAPGSCPFQGVVPTTGGRHVAVCQQPGVTFIDWKQFAQRLPVDSMRRYMTTDIVTARPDQRLPELARMMIDGGIRRLFITTASGTPVGVVSSTDLLAALAVEGARREEMVAMHG